MEKKQFPPFSLSKCYWRFCVFQAPSDFGWVFNQCFWGGNKGTIIFVQFQSRFHCDLPFQAWRQHLPQHQEAQPNWRSHCPKISRHWFSPKLSRWQQLGCPSLNQICTRRRVQSQKEHLFYKKTHCQPPLTNCSCWRSRLRAQQHLSALLLLQALLNV